MRYYQYLFGENANKIVILDHIDDTDPDMTIFVFDDGSRCNESLIMEINERNYQGKIMARIENPAKCWKVEEKKVAPQELKGVNKDGEPVIAADPYFFSKEGNMQHQAFTKQSITPPQKTHFLEDDDIKEYLLSYREKQSDAKNPKDAEASEISHDTTIEHENIDSDAPTQNEHSQINSNVETINQNNIIHAANSVDIAEYEALKIDSFAISNNIVIDVDKMRSAIHDSIIINGDTYNVDVVIKALKNVIDSYMIKSSTSPEKNDNFAEKDTSFNKTILEMYKNCAKKDAEVNLGIELALPSKEVFQLIKMNYPAEWAKMFIYLIVDSIDIDTLKQHMRDSILAMYNKDYEQLEK